MFLDFKLDLFLSEGFLRGVEVDPIHAEGKMMDGRSVRQRNGARHGTKRDGHDEGQPSLNFNITVIAILMRFAT